MDSRAAEITHLLRAWYGGDRAALEQLMPLVYEELRHVAQRCMQREQPGNTLQATAVVNEAFLRLVDVSPCTLAGPGPSLRHLCPEYAAHPSGCGPRPRVPQAWGGVVRLDLNESIDALPELDSRLVDLDEALTELAQFDARKPKVVELRFFVGLSVEETPEVLKISVIIYLTPGIRHWAGLMTG